MELQCVAQNYAWGIAGLTSRVAQLLKASSPDTIIDENTGYAELWMGTHPNGPSKVKASGEDLSNFLNKNPHLFGDNIRNKFGNQLCYLFKILSVNKALSIQAHPNKVHAEKLHAASPNVYKDPNHKPEMCIALTPFKALCGFRPAVEMCAFFQGIPELKHLIGEQICDTFVLSPTEDLLKECFSSLMHASQIKVTKAADELLTRIIAKGPNEKSITDDLFSTLCDQYPSDRGCFAIYFLNFVTLAPGEAMFLGPNLIHAYIAGDCVECMACSDNVVRAGLTPKFQDVQTLISMLEYEMLPIDARKFEGTPINDSVKLFNPPVPDFAVEMIKMEPGQKLSLPKYASASILIVIDGSSKMQVNPVNRTGVASPLELHTGSVLFIEEDQTLTMTSDSNFLAFRALCV